MALEDLKEQWEDAEDLERRKFSRLLLEFMIGKWKAQVKNEVRRQFAPETFERLKLQIDDSWNIMEYACQRIGAIYSQPVKRTVNGIDLADTVEGKIYLNGGMLDVAMNAANPLTLAVGNLFLRPMGIVDSMTGEMSMVTDMITPDQCVITESQEDPNGIDEILYCVGKGEKARFVYWSRDEHATFTKDWAHIPNPKNPSNINPYGILPFVGLRESYRIKDFFQARTGASLRSTTLAAASALTNFSYRLKSGCFKQPVIAGEPNKDFPLDHVLDSVTPLVLGPGGSANTMDLQSNYQQLLDTIIRRASSNLTLHGFTDEALRGIVTAQSGIALRVQKTDLQTAQNKQKRLYTFSEGDLYRIGRIVCFIDLGITLPDGVLEIDWPDVGPKASPLDLANLYNPMVDRAMVPKWYALMKIEGITEQRARELVAEARAETPPEMLPLIPADVQMPGATAPQPNGTNGIDPTLEA